MRYKAIEILGIKFNSLKDLTQTLGLKGVYPLARLGADPDAWVMQRLQINDRDLAREQLKALVKKRDTERLNLNNNSVAAASIDFEILNFLKALYISNENINRAIKMFYASKSIIKSNEEIEEFKNKIEQFLNI